ncbi:hypothetical protein DFO79_1221 [Pseudidiomarina tainanensis]|uniref:Uncharacterized protein n=2 Tax=Pseudidiomarina TaxID=2800384 RepID=A0A368UKB4_9GAMM|nr:hypothetical protein DET45_1201 [Pseudidiomarina maritima]RBP87194.1 hypothetical protein DFO81_1221 [Pseudidiomarina tainanensis]RCW29137.1 hypothetical protein DFO79_1221 [Pseudidiomarina tainanensis]
MQIETIKDVLSWTVDFHKNLKECVTVVAPAKTDNANLPL